MRAAVGGSYLLYIVIFFATVVIMLFASILSYSKAYRVKNKIIDMIEKDGVYSDVTAGKIDSTLKEYGYKTVSGVNCNFNKACAEENSLHKSGFNYCVCKHTDDSGIYYEVITYGQMEFPVIESLFTFTVHGETKTLSKNYNYN